MTTGRHRVFGSKKPTEFLLVDEEEEHVSQLKSFPKEQKASNIKSSSSSPVDNGTVWGSTEDGWDNASGWPDDKVESEDKSAWGGNGQKPSRKYSNNQDKDKEEEKRPSRARVFQNSKLGNKSSTGEDNGWENASGWPDDKVESPDKSASWGGNGQQPNRESFNKEDKAKEEEKRISRSRVFRNSQLGNNSSTGTTKADNGNAAVHNEGAKENDAAEKAGFLRKIEHDRSKSRSKSRVRMRSLSHGRKGHEKFMPPRKDELELFDSNRQIKQGAFSSQFYQKQEDEILITANNDENFTIEKLESFKQCTFTTQLVNNIVLKKYKKPTPIQKVVIPIIAKTRRDLMCHAQTGCGKTAAFLLPVMNELQQVVAKRQRTVNPDKPYMIIVSPTKELANQLFEDAEAFSINTGVRVVRTIGDMPMKQTLMELNAGCDVFIATCGRLEQFINERYINLEELRYLVLDEADKLLKIEPFNSCINMIKKQKSLNPDHRVLMFSATYEAGIQKAAIRLLSDNFVQVQIGEQMNMTVNTVTQRFIMLPKTPLKEGEKSKVDKLVDFLLNNKNTHISDCGKFMMAPKTFVFVELRRHSYQIATRLCQANLRACSLNADHSLKQRYEAVENFATNKFDIIVATDVAARGLNFPNVIYVINFDLPSRHPRGPQEEYVHRIGRSGRNGNEGRAISFFDPDRDCDVRNAPYFVQKLEEVGEKVPKWLHAIAEQNKAESTGTKEDSSSDAASEKNTGNSKNSSTFDLL